MMGQGKKTPDGRRIIYQQDEKTNIILDKIGNVVDTVITGPWKDR